MESPNHPVWEDLKNTFANMATLRANHNALTQNSLEAILVDNDRKLLIFKRWNDQGNQVVVWLSDALNRLLKSPFRVLGSGTSGCMIMTRTLVIKPTQTISLPPSGGKVWIAA